MPQELKAGLHYSAEMIVTPEMTVPGNADRLPSFADMPNVLATAYLVAFIEATCLDSVRPYLKEGEHTVGTLVGITHTAATPVGMKIFADIELVEVDGRKLTFKVTCRDEVELIGGGLHERYIVDVKRFMNKMIVKSA